MRLIDVEVFLERERQIKEGNVDRGTKPVLKELDDATTDYSILSHRWVGNEVNYKEMTKLAKMENRDEIRERSGYQKIVKSCERAKEDGLKWLWVDTCCIDKRNSTELSEAINSMFRWYQNSKKCYAYLHDVAAAGFPTSCDTGEYPGSSGWPEWFSRGWTLQELIAPTDLQFFNKVWQPIGDKRNLSTTLEKITRVPSGILEEGLDSDRPSVAQIMSWAADRKTTRDEDRAYSLMGLVGINMPMLYGEGEKAFLRFQHEIMRKSNDQTIFAWNPTSETPEASGVLADKPSHFRDCHDIIRIKPEEFHSMLRAMSFDGVSFYDLNPWREFWPSWKFTLADVEESHISTVADVGIRVRLPFIPYPGYPLVSKVVLACKKRDSSTPITIDVVCWRSIFYRFTGAVGWHPLSDSYQYSKVTLAYEHTGAPSGFVIDKPDGVAATLREVCAIEPRVADGGNPQHFSVTRAETHHVVDERLRILALLTYYLCLCAVISTIFLLGITLGGHCSWFACGEAVLLLSCLFWTSLEVSAITPVVYPRTENTLPPRNYILKFRDEIVVLTGDQRAITSITRAETIFPLQTLRTMRVVAVILQAIPFAALMKVPTDGNLVSFSLLFAQFLTMVVIQIIWIIERQKLLRYHALILALGRPKLTKYTFGSREPAVVLALLLSGTEKADEVMNELSLTQDSKAWKKWKTIVLAHIKNGGRFNVESSDWDDGTWTGTEKENLNRLFQDARKAYQVFEEHFKESVSQNVR
ncbi:heterokaryon incompatibility protein-domain-containing protein [Pisolithus tinctorius]|uniref:Uncharacterized protein n=1 Tax=Pisolithus tinctorius Marx 270 TaxID=870435 RepID=A0A0C3IAF7_PISTI|nr:heterokaryon incompatibility protein-domain-containing protein [Pisolithus tinctorius]KIN94067.1 hypothetical protein M404DRAFT_414347 [Pisolithus tinctorius Marx 270]